MIGSTLEIYRSILLTCMLCNVMEHVVLKHLWKHLHQLKSILKFIHGFQSGLSYEMQLIQALQDWSKSIDDKWQVHIILLNFSKTFDRFSYKCLLSKLEYYFQVDQKQDRILPSQPYTKSVSLMKHWLHLDSDLVNGF